MNEDPTIDRAVHAGRSTDNIARVIGATDTERHGKIFLTGILRCYSGTKYAMELSEHLVLQSMYDFCSAAYSFTGSAVPCRRSLLALQAPHASAMRCSFGLRALALCSLPLQSSHRLASWPHAWERHARVPSSFSTAHLFQFALQ